MPDWLTGVKVEFVCNNCPNRQTKNIAFISLEPEQAKTGIALDEEEVDVEELPDEDIEV
jgi:hypothetical protein